MDFLVGMVVTQCQYPLPKEEETQRPRSWEKTSRLWEQAANFFIQWWKNHWFCQSSFINTYLNSLLSYHSYLINQLIHSGAVMNSMNWSACGIVL
jgi:hypothetical protein